MTRSLRPFIQAVAAAGLLGGLATLAGCGGIKPGDYIVYKVAASSEDQSSGCYGGTVPQDDKYDTSSFKAAGTFTVFASKDDKFYLDAGAAGALEGTLDADTYTFSGKQTDVNFSAPNGGGCKSTATITATITLTVDGNIVTGEAVTKASGKYSGTGCPSQAPLSCTKTTEFVGSEIDDVELKHDI